MPKQHPAYSIPPFRQAGSIPSVSSPKSVGFVPGSLEKPLKSSSSRCRLSVRGSPILVHHEAPDLPSFSPPLCNHSLPLFHRRKGSPGRAKCSSLITKRNTGDGEKKRRARRALRSVTRLRSCPD
ncbi:hypothetical protein KM043_015777 [Ampulex compressa]|nr:hypothetical protein KM043_015777 [Ampulex compressa]